MDPAWTYQNAPTSRFRLFTHSGWTNEPLKPRQREKTGLVPPSCQFYKRQTTQTAHGHTNGRPRTPNDARPPHFTDLTAYVILSLRRLRRGPTTFSPVEPAAPPDRAAKRLRKDDLRALQRLPTPPPISRPRPRSQPPIQPEL